MQWRAKVSSLKQWAAGKVATHTTIAFTYEEAANTAPERPNAASPRTSAAPGVVKDSKREALKKLETALRTEAPLRLDAGPLVSLVLATVGNVAELARFSAVCKGWRDTASAPAVHSFCVRWGDLSTALRPFYWLHVAGIREPPPNDLYDKLVKAGRETKWRVDIATDVQRSYEQCPDLRSNRVELFEPGSWDFEGGSAFAPEGDGGDNGGSGSGGNGGGGGGEEGSGRGEDSDGTVAPTPCEARVDVGNPSTSTAAISEVVARTDSDGTKGADKIVQAGVGECVGNGEGRRSSSAGPRGGASNRRSAAPGDAVALRTFRILLAAAAVDADIGYCQGADHICREMVECMLNSVPFSGRFAGRGVEEMAFCLFNACLHEPYGLARMYEPGMRPLQIRCLQFASLLRLFMPRLCAHFKQEQLVVEHFVVGWMQTLFVYMKNASFKRRVWTIFLYEKSWKIILRVALALLKLAEPELLSRGLDGMLAYLSNYPEGAADGEAILATALSLKVTRRQLAAFQRRWGGPPGGDSGAVVAPKSAPVPAPMIPTSTAPAPTVSAQAILMPVVPAPTVPVPTVPAAGVAPAPAISPPIPP